MKNEIIKFLAQRAKERMTGDNITHKSMKLNLGENYSYRLIEENEEEVLYSKVRTMLDDDMDVINPIKILMDEVRFESLDKEGKQRYLFSVSEKYEKLRARYEAELHKVAR